MKIKQKKSILLIMVVCMMAFLCACNDDSDENSSTVDSNASTSYEADGDESNSFTQETTTNQDNTSDSETKENHTSTEEQSENVTTKDNSAESNTTEATTTEQVTTACKHSYGEWKVTVASTCSKKGTRTRTCTLCGDTKSESIATTPHTPVKDAGVKATCTTAGKTEGSHCSVCNTIVVRQETISALGHNESVIKGTPATETSAGTTDGRNCTTCGEVIVAQMTIKPLLESCNGDYAYKTLASQANGTAKQELYKRIDEKVKEFHTSTTANAVNNVAVSVAFEDLGISIDEAILVWMAYKNDNPLFFWISQNLNFENSMLNIMTDNAYANASDRTNYKNLIYNKITEYCAITSGETSAYQIALAYHDTIIDTIDYAYESDGSTPVNEEWAHSILGVFDNKKGVCEAYARAFQLMLNVRGVENIFVSGISMRNGTTDNHAWNLVKLDDGNWYWCDLTWDDIPGWEWGIRYNYFCINDTQNTNWSDDSGAMEPAMTFMDDHSIGVSANDQPVYNIEMPARSNSKFASSSDKILRDKFTVDNAEYSVAGYRTLQLINTLKGGEIIIPEKVKHNGHTYTVISIGACQENYYYGSYTGVAVVFHENTKITIPKSVKFIWDKAFNSNVLEEISVDKDNPYFTSINGVLFTKSLYTLIKYPSKAPKVDKFVIPDATVRIAENAFANIWDDRIGELVLGKNLEYTGNTNWGSGYLDKAPTGWFNGNFVEGELGKFRMISGSEEFSPKISVNPANERYKIVDGLLYRKDDWGDTWTLECTTSRDITTVVIPDYVDEISGYAFDFHDNLTSVTIGTNVIRISDMVFYCKNLDKINYKGTKAQWNAINLDGYFAGGNAMEIICTDGTIKKDGN